MPPSVDTSLEYPTNLQNVGYLKFVSQFVSPNLSEYPQQ